MPKQLKCQHCLEFGEPSIMKKGITKKGYIHIDCILDFQEKEKQKEIEKREWDELYQYLIDLYDAVTVPTYTIKKLHELKKSKSVSYKMILDAYKYAEDKIRWFMNNVNDGNDAYSMNAGITLMIKHGLNPVFKMEKEKRKRENEIQKQMSTSIVQDVSLDFKYKVNKKDELDISDLLD